MKNRSLIKMLVLSIITLGIYQIYWLYKTREELVSLRQEVPSFWLLVAPYITVILVFGAQLVINSSPSTSMDAQLGTNIISLILGLVAIIAIIPVTIYWHYKYCKAASFATGGKPTFDMSFVLFIIFWLFGLSVVWPFIMQDGYNTANVQPTPQPAAPQSPNEPGAFPPVGPTPPQAPLA